MKTDYHKIGTPEAPGAEMPPSGSIPTPLLMDRAISDGAKITFCALYTFANKNLWAFPSLEKLGVRSGLSRSQLIRCLKGLEGAGWIVNHGRHPEFRVFMYELVVAKDAPAIPAELEPPSLAPRVGHRSENDTNRGVIRELHKSDPELHRSDPDTSERRDRSQEDTGSVPSCHLQAARTTTTNYSSTTSSPAREEASTSSGHDDDAFDATSADPADLPPWHQDAPTATRAAFDDLARRASSRAAFQRLLMQLRDRDGISFSLLGAALVELAPRSGAASANDLRVFVRSLAEGPRRPAVATVPGGRARAAGMSGADALAVIDGAIGAGAVS